MRWAVALVLLAGTAHAQDEPEPPVAKQELGARLGAQVGLTELAPGGLRLAGVYLYRVDEDYWFDGEAGFVFGGDGDGCHYTRDEELSLSCDHAGLDGFSMGLAAGVRRFWPVTPSGFHPYVRGQAGVSYVDFSADGVAGLGISALAGAGTRYRVAPRVALVGEGLLGLGPGLYDEGLGGRFNLGLIVQLGVEFAL
jgi:hypothetical protein